MAPEEFLNKSIEQTFDQTQQIQIMNDNQVDRPMSSKSNVEVPVYDRVTDMERIPYE